jgi:hypothetical protein
MPDTTLRGAVHAGEARRPGAGRLSSWLGRIAVRAGLISVLMLLVVGLLSTAALVVVSRQVVIVEQLGLRDREADAAVDELALHVADFSSAFASVIAGVLQPGRRPGGWCGTGSWSARPSRGWSSCWAATSTRS